MHVAKILELVSAERAQELGIKTELPVFVSPYIDNRYMCDACDREYAPLLYAFHRPLFAHHDCKFRGGLYVYDAFPKRNMMIRYIAEGEAEGVIRGVDNDPHVKQVSQLILAKLHVFCWCCGNSFEAGETVCLILDRESGGLYPACRNGRCDFIGRRDNRSCYDLELYLTSEREGLFVGSDDGRR